MPDESRTQPEFSLGERLATLEATMAALDRRFDESGALFDEKLDGLRRELQARSEAQKEAVDKAEQATAAQFGTFAVENARKGDDTQKRLQALEGAVSIGAGRAQGVSELKTSTLAIVGAIATVALTILYVVPLLK